MVKLSVVFPAYNEGKNLEKNMRGVLKYLKSSGYSFEVILVNDGSIDNTETIAKKIKGIQLITYRINQGKGFAVKKGMLAAKGDYVLFADVDQSTPIQEVEKLMKETKKYGVVIASREVKEANVEGKIFRRLLARCFSFLVNVLVISGIKDTQCGFKLFSKNAVRNIFHKQTLNRWAFDVEILYLAKKSGYKIKEVGVNWQHYDHPEDTSPPVKNLFRMFRDVLKVRWNIILGKY